jgi:hypothetical protein
MNNKLRSLLMTAGSSSTSIKTWQVDTTGEQINSVAYSPTLNLFAAISQFNVLCTSTNGNDWVVRDSGQTGHLFFSIRWTNSQFIISASQNTPTLARLLTSTDGITWSSVLPNRDIQDVEGNGSIYIGNNGQTNGSMFSSTNLVNWTPIVTASGRRVIWTGTQFVAIGARTSGEIYTSPNGTTWTFRSGAAGTLSDIAWSGSMFVVTSTTSNTIYTSSDGASWTARTVGVAQVFNNVIWNGTQFVIVGNNRAIATSTDGIAWTQRSPVPTALSQSFTRVSSSSTNNVTFSSNGRAVSSNGTDWTIIRATCNEVRYSPTLDLFVGVGNSGFITTSTDGISWTTQTSNTTNQLESVTWTGTQFIAVGASGTILTSPNGVTWTVRSGASGALNSVVSNGSTIIAIGASAFTSSDGITWTARTLPGWGSGTGNFNSIIWDGTKFLASGTAGIISTSVNGATWTTTVRRHSEINAIIYISTLGKFVATGRNGAVLQSTDGFTWTTSTNSTSIIANYTSIASDGTNIVIAAGTTIHVSSNGGTSFISRTSNAAGNLNALIWDGSRYVGVGVNTVITSPDSTTWTARSGVSGTMNAVAHSGSMYVTVSLTGTIFSSPDSITWTSRTSNTVNSLNSIVSNGSIFVAVGATGTVITSPDGITWTTRTSNTTAPLTSVIWDGARFVAIASNLIITSPDGITWTSMSSLLPTNQTQRLAYNGTRYIAAGNNGIIYTSTDLAIWLPVAGGNIQQLLWDGTRYIGGDSLGTILTSLDGVAWTASHSGTTTGFSSIIKNGETYTLAGTGVNMRSSTDLNSWTSENAGFTGQIQSMAQSSTKIVAVGFNGVMAYKSK